MGLLTLLATSTMASALRKVLVTGANKGIGKRIATKILTDVDDSFVYLGARDASRGAAAVAGILATAAALGRAAQFTTTSPSSSRSLSESLGADLLRPRPLAPLLLPRIH